MSATEEQKSKYNAVLKIVERIQNTVNDLEDISHKLTEEPSVQGVYIGGIVYAINAFKNHFEDCSSTFLRSPVRVAIMQEELERKEARIEMLQEKIAEYEEEHEDLVLMFDEIEKKDATIRELTEKLAERRANELDGVS